MIVVVVAKGQRWENEYFTISTKRLLTFRVVSVIFQLGFIHFLENIQINYNCVATMNYTKGRVNKRGYKRMGVYRGGSSRGHARTPRGSSKNLKQGLIIPTTTANAVIHELDLEFRGDNSLDDQDYQLKVQSQVSIAITSREAHKLTGNTDTRE